MKPKGRWIIGCDFGNGDQVKMLAIPMQGNMPAWNRAEVIDRDAFETMLDQVRERERAARRESDRSPDAR